MRITTILLAATSFTAISGHTIFSTLFIDDVNQGDATCIRMPMEGKTCTSPIIDLASNDMACNVDGSTGVARVCPAIQGSKLTFAWRWIANEPDSGAIDISHKGPCAVYMKKVDSAIKDPGHGDGWFKIYDFGHDENDEWCTEKLIKSKGLLSVKIPSDLAGGYYLVRPELLSLHQAYQSDENPSQPQFYTGCAQIFLDSSATGSPATTVSIPGYVKPSDPGMTFNIYTPESFPYPMHGPPISDITTSNSRVRVKSRTAIGPQTEGLKPENCVDENGNWCGTELASYSTLDGCFAQGKNCWEQLDPCYNGAPPTGYQGCSAWEDKCSTMTDQCNAGNFVGPPNAGKIITPAKPEFDLSIAIGMSGVRAVVPEVALSQDSPSQEASSSAIASSTDASASVAPSSTVIFTSNTSSSTSTDVPAATTTAASPGSVSDEPDVEIVYVTETVTIEATAPTPCQSTTNQKRQTFQFKPDGSLSNPAVSPDLIIPLGNIPEATAPVEPGAQSLPSPIFNFKNTGSNPNSISVETRPIVPTVDGSCGAVAGFKCEYDSILGTIPGCCSKFGYCGYSADHCGAGCQVGYGRCDGVPFRMAKRFERDLVAARRNDDEVLATVTVTPTCSAAAEPSVFSTPDVAEVQTFRALQLWGKGGQTVTITAPTCTPPASKISTSHIHRHLRPHHH